MADMPVLTIVCPLCQDEVEIQLSATEQPKASADDTQLHLSMDADVSALVAHVEAHKNGEMKSAAWIREARMGWTAAQSVAIALGDRDPLEAKYQKGLADGYVGALSMVLRPMTEEELDREAHQ